MIDKMHGQSFDWHTWRAYSFPIPNREQAILSNASFLREHSVGYCPGGELICRPKESTIAVMFLIDGIYQWTHFTEKEFEKIWKV